MRISKLITLLFICSFSWLQASSQVIQRSGYIYSDLSLKINSMPGDSGNHYLEPDTFQLTTWKHTLDQLFLGNYSSASDSANKLGYNLVHFLDTFALPFVTYYVLETAGINYWGTYVYNPNYCRPIVIQAPHAKKDANTGKQGIHVFRKTSAVFYQVNGTHRCNSSILSTCTGTTTGCSSSSQAYPISDLAHNTNSIFQKTTEVVMNTFPNSYFFQLHGFTKTSTDPYVILSNGTTITPSPDYISSFASNLKIQDSVLTVKIAHLDTNWTRLRGFWNTQSRLVNASPNPCNVSATSTQGRFVHIEQERVRLRSNVTAWNKTANALNNTFPCIPVGVMEQFNLSNYLKIFPNPVAQTLIIQLNSSNLDIKELAIYNSVGQLAKLHLIARQNNKLILNVEHLPAGLYIIKYKNDSEKILKL